MNGCFTEGPVCSVNWVDLLFYEVKPSIRHYPTVIITSAVIFPCHCVTLTDENYFQAPLWSAAPSCSVEDMVVLLGKPNTRSHTAVTVQGEHGQMQSLPVQTRGDQDGQDATELHRTGWTAQVNAGRVPEPSASPTRPSQLGLPSRGVRWVLLRQGMLTTHVVFRTGFCFTTFLGFAKKCIPRKPFLRIYVAFSALQSLSETYPREGWPR